MTIIQVFRVEREIEVDEDYLKVIETGEYDVPSFDDPRWKETRRELMSEEIEP